MPALNAYALLFEGHKRAVDSQGEGSDGDAVAGRAPALGRTRPPLNSERFRRIVRAGTTDGSRARTLVAVIVLGEYSPVRFVRCWSAISFRRNRRELVIIVALVGLLGGVSLFALAGARRTQSSYPRFLRAGHASTMAIDPGQYDPAINAAIAARPEVLSSTTYVAFQTGSLVDGRPDFKQDFETLGTFDGRFFTMDRFTPTFGRLPDVGRVDEVAVNEAAAHRFGYQIGQHLDLGTFSKEQVSSDSFFDNPPPPKIRTQVTIVGIGLFTDEVVQDDANRLPLALVTPAFSKQAAAYATYAWQGLTLRHGDADVASVQAWYLSQLDPGSPQFFRVTSVDTFHAQQAVRPLSLALAFFGMIAGVATVVLVSQSVNRHLRRGRADEKVLFSFGATTRELALASFLGAALALALGSVAAVGLAYFASPAMPIGVVRRVEASPGFDADWTVLGFGAALMFLALAVDAAFVAVRGLPNRPPTRRGIDRRSRIVGAAAKAGMSPPAVIGLRRAFEPGDDATSVPVRSVMIAGVIAIATVTASLTFGASFRQLLDSPHLYGWNWDATILDSAGYGNLDINAAHNRFDGKTEIAGWSGAYFGADSIDGHDVPLLGMNVRSDVAPPLIAGRMIEATNEIVLGSATADALGKHVGDSVQIGIGNNRTMLRVVGTATFPSIGIVHGAHTSLGIGALVVPDLVPGFNRHASGQALPGTTAGPPGPPVIFVRYRPGADQQAAASLVSEAAGSIGQYPGSAAVLGPQRPAEIVNSRDAGGVPTLLALALGAATAVSLAIALAASVHRRRHELALLQCLGFTRRQLATSVMWQATATMTVAVAIGLPLGYALGRALWAAFAQRLDVVPHTMIPSTPLLLVTATAIAATNIAAAFPALMARRLQPAELLRTP